jgi:hypothetical protein
LQGGIGVGFTAGAIEAGRKRERKRRRKMRR